MTDDGRWNRAVGVCHRDAFQKKSKRGIATPKADIERAVQRIKALRKQRDEPQGRAQIGQLLARRALRQQAIDERGKQKNEPK